jgi:plasmid stabilization system protein ParE
MNGYELTPHARDGLDQIIGSVAQAFGVRTAEKALDRLQEALDLLAENPSLGHIREDLTGREDVRLWSVPPTLLAYRLGDWGVEIVLVERGARSSNLTVRTNPC